MFKQTLLLLLSLAFCKTIFANNLQISNVSVTDENTGTSYVNVEFDISWDNSWRTDNLNGDGVTNWDAAWIFIKYKSSADGKWRHATLNTNVQNHTTGTGTSSTIAPRSDGKGIFLYRSGNSSGTFSVTDMQLRWETGIDGLSYNLNNEVASVMVFAIEMVYVPQGSFYIGSGGDETDHFYTYPETSSKYQITSEDAIPVGTTNGYMFYTDTYGSGGDRIGPIPGTFPKGYNDFYCMKYEITQEQYVAFLNTLDRTQQNARTNTDISGISVVNRFVMSNTSSRDYRNGIRCDETLHATDPITIYCDYNSNSTGNEAGDGQNIACNYLTWGDGAAYADWAALRPMTELEFEKACRGTTIAIANEYAWGTRDHTSSKYTINNAGAPNEGIATNYSTSLGNAIDNATHDGGLIGGPLRVGIFAAHTSNSGRFTSGGTYYGIMEMSGNVWERTITVGNSGGRSFTGNNGNGLLDANGDADVSNWPPAFSAVGSGLRGGSWNSDQNSSCVSFRHIAAFSQPDRHQIFGFRCVSRPQIDFFDRVVIQIWIIELLNLVSRTNIRLFKFVAYINSLNKETGVKK